MKINEILPQEDDFTEVLTTIALVPKMLFYYGKMPENSRLLPKNRAVNSAKSGQNGPEYQQNSAKSSKKSAENDDSMLEKPEKYDEICGKEQNVRPDLPKRPKTVAIVGARRHTSYGADVAYKMAYELAQYGVVVVSGMAVGIDSIAHRGALAAGGCTVAVLGTAIDKIYPSRHEGLAREIVAKGGCVMSEYGPGATTFKTSFLERNRLIAALADVVVVVEATDHSGSLNTATHALEQGRDLFAVPGDITRPISVGCNRLIAQGAMPYTCVEDILNVLYPAKRERRARQLPLFGDNKDETAVLKLLGAGESDGEAIAEQTELAAAKFNQVVTMLEIKGRVRSLGANQWVLA